MSAPHLRSVPPDPANFSARFWIPDAFPLKIPAD